MSYIVFARKYRPQTFADVIGQSPITTTLKNAVLKDRVAHAYIFAGPRGVGKTTTARILAKALNCEKGPTTTPCNACSSCIEITKGSSLDILEIDGASNRGIDEIRSLRENVKFAPSRGHFKVYIIDEVHMLTEPAFNALLKTLEEPPPHVKFIFATTQAYKVPATILSRCQRFDFRRIPTKEIFGSLKQISENEGLKIKDEALGLIAKYADGSMRDAQVVLDQMIPFMQGSSIESQDVEHMLGLVDEETLFGLADSIKEKDAISALKIIDRIVTEGRDIFQVVSSLIEHFRNLAIAKIGKEINFLIEAGPDKVKRYEAQAQKFTIEKILYIIYTLSNAIDFIRKTTLLRAPFEAAMVKIARSGDVVGLDEVLDKIEKLEKDTRAESANQKPLSSVKETVEKVNLAGDSNIDDITSAWASIINYIKAKKISVASYLQEGYPVGLEAGKLSIGFPKEFQFHKEVLDTPDNRRLIEEAISGVMRLDLRVAFTVVEPLKPKALSSVEEHEKEVVDEKAGETKEEASDKEGEPIIREAMEIFGGEISNRNLERRRG